MDILALIGVVSGVCSIATVVIPDKYRYKKLTFCLYVLTSVILSSFLIHYYTIANWKSQIKKAAQELVNNKQTDFTPRGFIQAGLSFCEQNKEYYPDTYERAKEIERNSKIGNDDVKDVDYSYEMEGLLRGVAILNTN